MTANAQFGMSAPRLHKKVFVELEYPVLVTQEDGTDTLLRGLMLDPARALDRLGADHANLNDADKVLQAIAMLANVSMNIVDCLDTADLLNLIDRCHEIYKGINAQILFPAGRDPCNSIATPPFRKKFPS